MSFPQSTLLAIVVVVAVVVVVVVVVFVVSGWWLHAHNIAASLQFRICYAMGLPVKIRASSTFEDILRPKLVRSRSQVAGTR